MTLFKSILFFLKDTKQHQKKSAVEAMFLVQQTLMYCIFPLPPLCITRGNGPNIDNSAKIFGGKTKLRSSASQPH